MMKEVSIRLKRRPPTATRQSAGVRLIHKAVADADRIEALAELCDLQALLLRHMRHVPRLDCIIATRSADL